MALAARAPPNAFEAEYFADTFIRLNHKIFDGRRHVGSRQLLQEYLLPLGDRLADTRILVAAGKSRPFSKPRNGTMP
jgi:hypothetical protein